MIKTLSYERLSNIVKNNKPYRGSTNRYPLMRRKHSYKCFFVEKDAQGNDEYHIAYQYEYKRRILTTKEAEEYKSANKWAHENPLGDGSTEYYVYDRYRKILGIVRNDNTMEFTTSSMHQGERMFLTWVNDGEVISSVRHGGTIYREYERDHSKPTDDNPYGKQVYWKDTMIVPLFKGQRIDIDTAKSVINYEVHLPYVNRKRSKEALEAHKNDLNFMETLFKTMSSDIFTSEMKDVYDKVFINIENKPMYSSHRYGEDSAGRMMLRYAKETLATNFYESMYAMMMGLNILGSWSVGAGNNSYRLYNSNPLEYFKATKAKLVKQINIEKETLDTKVYKPNEVYPSNAWDIKILVDGKEVKCY